MLSSKHSYIWGCIWTVVEDSHLSLLDVVVLEPVRHSAWQVTDFIFATESNLITVGFSGSCFSFSCFGLLLFEQLSFFEALLFLRQKEICHFPPLRLVLIFTMGCWFFSLHFERAFSLLCVSRVCSMFRFGFHLVLSVLFVDISVQTAQEYDHCQSNTNLLPYAKNL